MLKEFHKADKTNCLAHTATYETVIFNLNCFREMHYHAVAPNTFNTKIFDAIRNLPV